MAGIEPAFAASFYPYKFRRFAGLHLQKFMPRQSKPRQCKSCNEYFTYSKYRSVFCLNCVKDQEYYENLTLGEYRNRSSVKHKHPSWANSHIRLFCRSWNQHLRELPCQVCGYENHVELAHIKPISEFEDNAKLQTVNSSDNLLVLCRNHHWEFDHGMLSLVDIPVRPKQKITHEFEQFIPIKKANERKIPKTRNRCIDCNTQCCRKSTRCLKCSNSKPRLDKRKVERPSKEELQKLVWELPTMGLAKQFGVSDKAIEKWCKDYQIAKPPRGYWAKVAATKVEYQKGLGE